MVWGTHLNGSIHSDGEGGYRVSRNDVAYLRLIPSADFDWAHLNLLQGGPIGLGDPFETRSRGGIFLQDKQILNIPFVGSKNISARFDGWHPFRKEGFPGSCYLTSWEVADERDHFTPECPVTMQPGVRKGGSVWLRNSAWLLRGVWRCAQTYTLAGNVERGAG